MQDRLAVTIMLWTGCGVDDELALMRNLLIAGSWGFAVLIVAMLAPIPRTQTVQGLPAQEIVSGLLFKLKAVVGRLAREQLSDEITDQLTAASGKLKQGAVASMAEFEPGFINGFLEEELRSGKRG